MKMDETSNNTSKAKGYGIYKMLDAVKSKLPTEYKDYIYKGLYIGLKSDYARYIIDPSRNNRMQFYMLFVKDSPDRTQKYNDNFYRKSTNALWFYLCSGFNKYELMDLSSPMKRELFTYIKEHEIVVLDYYNEKMFREEKIFYFDDSKELKRNNKYEKYVEELKNKYTK